MMKSLLSIALAIQIAQAGQTLDPVKTITENDIDKAYCISFATEYGGAFEEASFRESKESFPYSTYLLAKYFRESERVKPGFGIGALRMVVDLSGGRTVLMDQEGKFMLRGKDGKPLGYYMMRRVEYMKLAVAVELFLSRIG